MLHSDNMTAFGATAPYEDSDKGDAKKPRLDVYCQIEYIICIGTQMSAIKMQPLVFT